MNRFSSILLAIIAFLIVALWQQCGNERLTEDLYHKARKDAITWRDEAGKAHATNEVVVADLESIKQAYGDSLLVSNETIKGLKINLSNLRGQTTITTTVTDTITMNLVDTIGQEVKTFSYRDDWSLIEGRLDKDILSLSYQIDDSISLVSYSQKKSLLSRDVTVVEAVSHNPNVSIRNLKSLEIKHPPNRLGIGVSVGVTYVGNFRPYVGVGINYTIIKIR